MRLPRPSALAAGVLLLGAVLSGCGGDDADADPGQPDAVEAPQLGACRVLDAEAVAQPSNTDPAVECAAPHTAETFAVGDLPAELHGEAWDSEALGTYAYQTCSEKFRSFLGADESTVMRSVVSWAWFRPSEQAWDDGARWYRCDVVGGSEETASFVELPETAAGLLSDRPDDRWMTCVDGASVQAAPKTPCTEKHVWRAVTTIKVGAPADAYPGDRVVEVTSRDYCSESVAAWLGYPPEYDFGYTFFHEGEWKAGNRRSICWAKTAQ